MLIHKIILKSNEIFSAVLFGFIFYNVKLAMLTCPKGIIYLLYE